MSIRRARSVHKRKKKIIRKSARAKNNRPALLTVSQDDLALLYHRVIDQLLERETSALDKRAEFEHRMSVLLMAERPTTPAHLYDLMIAAFNEVSVFSRIRLETIPGGEGKVIGVEFLGDSKPVASSV